MAMTGNGPIWEPSAPRKKAANLASFIDMVNRRHKQSIATYGELQRWSVSAPSDFWALMWEFGRVKASVSYDSPTADFDDMLGVKWFPGARLNFAENLLRFRDDRTALIFRGENREASRLSYADLYDQVARLAHSLRESGIKPGDRVAGFMPNMTETVVAMLATTSLGGIWSSCSPDFGPQGVLDRFEQIAPKILFSADGYSYNGKIYDSVERLAAILPHIPSIEKVIVVPHVGGGNNGLSKAVRYDEFIAHASGLEISFEQLPFDHPIYIVFSSGTTDRPKCVVHRAGGILIQHLKELMLNSDMKQGDTIFYFTTCGWVMWNWMVSSLSQGATLVLYDGSPFYPDNGAMFKLVQDERASIFGTSPRYLAAIEKAGIKPRTDFDLSRLKTMITTGSPLSVENYEYVYRDIKPDVFLNNISGGTEAIACFGIGNPISPIYAGEMQGLGLGMNVRVFDQDGKPLVGQEGELVCISPFPSMPLRFWNDDKNLRYKSTYFDVYPNVWRHGDFARITENGGLIISGRSDATLKPGGVRIGTAEIYRQVETVPGVLDSVVVGQEWEGDVRIVLFVKLGPGVHFDDALVQKIRSVIRNNASPRHVPAKIIAVADIPYTANGKKVELAVRNVIHGKEVVNREALANPEALELYKDLAELKS